MENNNQDSVNNQQNPQEFIKPEPQNNQQFSNINSQNSGNYTSSGEVVNNIVDNSQQQYINQAAQNQFKPQANKSDTLGLVSIILAFIGLQIIGIVLGIIGVKKGKKEGYKYTLSKVGIWINGVILLVVSLIVIAIAFVSVDNVSRNASDTSSENYLKAVSSSLEENFTVTKKIPNRLSGASTSIRCKINQF
jgi:hypothetical protein